MKKAYLECGRINRVHGIKGAVKAESWCDSPDILAHLKTVFVYSKGQYLPLKITKGSTMNGSVLLFFEGYSTPEAAETLKGATLYASRDDIPVNEGEALLSDLIGLPVTDANTARVYGTLTDISFLPASIIYTVTTPQGEEVLLPAVDEFIKEANGETGLLITPIPGFFDEV